MYYSPVGYSIRSLSMQEVTTPDLLRLVSHGDFRLLLEDLRELTHVTVGLIGLDGRIIAQSGLTEVCGHFHLSNPRTNAMCEKHKLHCGRDCTRSGFAKPETCPLRLHESTEAVIVNGKHICSLFIGQFFIADNPPEKEWFRRVARAHGFEETEYFESIRKVPILSRRHLEAIIAFQPAFARMIGDMVELQTRLSEAWRENKTIQANLSIIMFALEKACEATYLIDSDGSFLYANKAATDMLGYSREEFLSMKVYEIDDHIPPKEWIARWKKTRKLGHVTTQTTHRAQDGHLVPLEINTNGFEYEGRFFYVAFARDISTRLAYEERLRYSQKLEAIGQLSCGMSHDFNNILLAINLTVSLMQQQKVANSMIKKGLADILTETKRAGEITRKLLCACKRSVMEKKSLETNGMIGSLLNVLRRLVGENVMTDFTGSGKSLFVNGDAGMLEQVIINLVVNARDAMPEGGNISIRIDEVEIDEDACIRHPRRRCGDFAVIAVKDTGTGIDDETMSRLFEPFFTTKPSGTGLGLATAQEIVDRHDGWIEVGSVLGKGSVFSIFLPVVETRPDVANRVTVPTVKGEAHLLVVEDEETVLRTLSQSLRALGYTVHGARNVREALDILKDKAVRLDLLLTDLKLQGHITGTALAKRAVRLRKEIRILIMSGYVDRKISCKGLPSGHFRLLQKPFSLSTLTCFIREALNK